MRKEDAEEPRGAAVPVQLSIEVAAAAVAAAASRGEDLPTWVEDAIRARLRPLARCATPQAVDPALVDLFCTVAERTPDLLSPALQTVYQLLIPSPEWERYWRVPACTVEDLERAGAQSPELMPWLDRPLVRADWNALVARSRGEATG